MTAPQTPTPGVPLSAESVHLLKAGDVLRIVSNTGPIVARFVEAIEPFDYHSRWAIHHDQGGGASLEHTSFVGRPDAEGWMTWSGGENPVPGQMVDFRVRDGREITAGASCELDWSHDTDPRYFGGCDITAFRLTTPSDQGEAFEPSPERYYPSSTTPASGSDGLETVAWRAELEAGSDDWMLSDDSSPHPRHPDLVWEPLVTREAAEKRIADLNACAQEEADALASRCTNAEAIAASWKERALDAESQVAALKAALPDLTSVIGWLANGCDPQHAVTELHIYQDRIDQALALKE